MKQLLILSSLILLALGCKKTEDKPVIDEPVPIIQQVDTTKVVSITLNSPVPNGTFTAVWDYDHVTPVTGIQFYSVNGLVSTFSATVKIEADSAAFGYTAPAPNQSPISYTVYVDGVQVKVDTNTMKLGFYAKLN